MDDVNDLLDLAARIWLRTHPEFREQAATGRYDSTQVTFLAGAENALLRAALA